MHSITFNLMENRYEEIVRRFADPSGEFFQRFKNTLKKYRPTLSDERIRDVYQDSFIEAQKSLMAGRIRENTSWNSYLISIGLNLATHEFRDFDRTQPFENSDMKEEEIADYNTPEVQRVFGEVLSFMKEKCRKILEWTLYDRLSSEAIAITLNSTSRSIITQRNQCKKTLIDLVRAKLKSLGYEIND